MRKIPSHIQDSSIIEKLNTINQQIDEKMKKINIIRDQMKSGPNDVQLTNLKKISIEIDALDQEWKKISQ